MSQKIKFSLLLSVLISLVSTPAFADTGVNMSNDQTTVISGNGNNVSNRSKQSIDSHQDGKSKEGVSIRNKQVCDIVGDGNTCLNQSEQKVEIRRRRR
jgi:uncharacterized protein YdeI (BOF family)